MKKIILRELFWFIMSFVLSLFLSLIFLEILDLTSTERSMKSIEKIFSVQLYIVGCIVSFICIYIVRVIIAAIKMFTNV
tara:strand:- start:543 stop:779 length:237 start_codon:yes stop_codon:yes gene_type:complete